ncbi:MULTISPECIES: formate dehydrogenase subunit gamma [unclassified Acidovorax]|uniref:formate dehydrogenase subunit gamma n=1 Tax=unclassified Acidovorax TaxID=2684926 RepID=UPI0006F4B409|nr:MULTISPECIES: formate dehydrogenase subunit gamma [unclassified Acidovorax]KRB42144.1 formate dehydrogenase [Acidovorax sp. Root70]PUA95660.1 formate dehydrogenase gamma subunit [Acidovorax sp. 107]
MKYIVWSMALAASLAWGPSSAQTPPAAPDASAAAAPAAPTAVGGVQSQNIFQVKPDASADPKYAEQTNGERMKVQPGNNAPMWRQVGQGVTGYSSLPVTQAPEAGNLIQRFVQYPGSRVTNAGEAWRQVRNHWIIPYGAALFAIVLLALGIFYFVKGPLGHEHPDDASARRIERFTPFERAAHWSNAFAFITLAISGIVMAFGKFFLLPIMGATLFGWLTYALKNVHNFMGPLFAVSLAVIILTFVKDNIANRADFVWLSKGGGMLGGDHQVPSHRFNAGEKGLFWWGITIPGIFVVGTGLVLDKLIPGFGDVRGDMQIAHMIHATLAIWMMALICGHIYMGTVGMRGAYKAMKTGYVSEGWAQEHHELWYDDVQAGKIPRQRSANPSAADTAATPSAGQPAQV